MKAFLAAGAWFTAAVVLVVGSVVVLSWIGFLDQISILFYRGLVLIAVGEVFCFAVLRLARRIWPIWHVRDVVSACAFAGGIAVPLLIVLPVTAPNAAASCLAAPLPALNVRLTCELAIGPLKLN